MVFDESFVRAARLQEFSAQERLDDHAPAVRNRRFWLRNNTSRQAAALVLLITLAFATAVYMGVRNPTAYSQTRDVEAMRASVVPLAPNGEVPGGSSEKLFAHSPAARLTAGAAGVTLPAAKHTENFSQSQVRAALNTTKEYVVQSALAPNTLSGGSARAVRLLLDPAQSAQFDQSFRRPRADGKHAATGWVVRFDPSAVRLADSPVRVGGTLTVSETSSTALEVVADHTFVYALRPVGSTLASLFVVRRESRLRFDRSDLRDHHLELLENSLQAGPQACSAASADFLRPVLAGQHAKPGGPAGTNPYQAGRPRTTMCGSLAASVQPSLPAADRRGPPRSVDQRGGSGQYR